MALYGQRIGFHVENITGYVSSRNLNESMQDVPLLAGKEVLPTDCGNSRILEFICGEYIRPLRAETIHPAGSRLQYGTG